MLGAAPPSPNCTVATPPAELPKQAMLPLIKLLPTSIASGSAMVLLTIEVLPPTWTLSVPSQHDCRPLMVDSADGCVLEVAVDRGVVE